MSPSSPSVLDRWKPVETYRSFAVLSVEQGLCQISTAVGRTPNRTAPRIVLFAMNGKIVRRSRIESGNEIAELTIIELKVSNVAGHAIAAIIPLKMVNLRASCTPVE